MSVLWLQPGAWFAAALLLVPLLIHLLTRYRSQRVAFPSLRFLPVSQLAALRSRVVTDWPLLAVRTLLVLAAIAAAAAPVFVSDARRATWNDRIARAIVVAGPLTGDVATLVDEETRGSFVSMAFAQPLVPDALREASRWLGNQPPAAREIVVVGDLREGALSVPDLSIVPPSAGLRFLPVVSAPEVTTMEWRAVGVSQQTLETFAARVIADQNRTHVAYEAVGSGLPSLRVIATPDQQPYADALLRAVLGEGVLLTDRRVTIAFAGATLDALDRTSTPGVEWMRDALAQNPAVRGGEVDGALVVRADLPVTDRRAPRLVADLVRAAFAQSAASLEPRRISAATLAAWSRPAGGSPPDALPADEGDRRWFWGLALALLAIETVLRRTPRAA